MTPGQRAFVWLQHLLPQKLLTAFAGAFARRQVPLLSGLAIRLFIRLFRVDMTQSACSDPGAYRSFNAFFTRALIDDARPLAAAPALLCPCDGVVSECGPLDGTRLLQVKGVSYRAADLLADPALAENFRDGSFATIYLTPADYHRVHMPTDGYLERMLYVPGSLYSVNPATVAGRPGLFARNERVVSSFRGEDGHFAMVLVGAMIVGGIRTRWAGRVTPRTAEPWQMAADARVLLERGDEMGLFELGSTVVLLFPGGTVALDPDLAPGRRVRMGEAIGRML